MAKHNGEDLPDDVSAEEIERMLERLRREAGEQGAAPPRPPHPLGRALSEYLEVEGRLGLYGLLEYLQCYCLAMGAYFRESFSPPAEDAARMLERVARLVGAAKRSSTIDRPGPTPDKYERKPGSPAFEDFVQRIKLAMYAERRELGLPSREEVESDRPTAEA